MDAGAILNQVVSGISNGMLLFIVASGLTLIFGVLRVINFAHGSLYMIGAYLAVLVTGFFVSNELGFFAALLVVPALVAALGYFIERLLFRRIYGKEHLLQLLLTYGLTLVLGDVVRIIWGGSIYRVARPDFLRGRTDIFGLRVLNYDLFLLVIGLIIGAGLWYLLQRTRFGRITRAAVTHPDILSALGTNVSRVYTLCFMLGAWLAGLGGALVAARSAVGLRMDSELIIQAFAIVVIGGLGSFAGALIGSLLVGVTLSVGIILPDIFPGVVGDFFRGIPSQALPFIAMVLILILRPYGLLGKPER